MVVYLLLAMVLFFQSGYGDVWDKLVQGLEWARQFRVRVALGMQPSDLKLLTGLFVLAMLGMSYLAGNRAVLGNR